MHEQELAAAQAAYEQADYIAALTALAPLMNEDGGESVFALLGETLQKLKLPSEAAEAFEQAARKQQGNADGLLAKAVALYVEAGDDDRAQLLGIPLLSDHPADPALAFALARSFRRSGDLSLIGHVLATLAASDDPAHLMLAGDILNEDDRNPLALAVFRRLAALYPDDPFTQFKFMSVAREFCDFAAVETLERTLAMQRPAEAIAFLTGETAYSNLLRCGDERLNRHAVNTPGLTDRPSPVATRQRRMRPHAWGEKIRIGYLSCDFWSGHATMRLLQNVLERHDDSRFEITLFCHTPERHALADAGNRQRWGRLVSILNMSDAEAADLIRQNGIDILVDLKGHTGGSRSAILNQMAAPVQVAWLGFPSSAVNIDCDYVIGDRIVLPDDARHNYHEKFCRLPESYQPNDPVHRALPPAAERAALGLPHDRFVFAAFNASRKITPAVLDAWAEILRRADTAVLWAMIDGDLARANFMAAIEARGIAAERIILAEAAPYEAHIARLQAADLGLDTFPYNGHTTTSDKLWAGLPVVTMKGTNFASRVSESLLTAIGLPDLVAADRQGFVDLAVSLAQNPDKVLFLKKTLVDNRRIAPLFDAERFCRHLETGYDMMADRAKAKLPPEHIDVAPLTARTVPFR